MLWCSECGAGIYPIWILEKFSENDMKLGQAVLILIDGSLLESTSSGMKDIPLVFVIVPDQDIVLPHYLELGPFMYDFISPPVLGPCLGSDEELKCAGKVVYVLKGEVMELSCVFL